MLAATSDAVLIGAVIIGVLVAIALLMFIMGRR